MSVAFAVVLAFWCASRPAIQAFVFFLLCVAPHPVLGFLRGLAPSGVRAGTTTVLYLSLPPRSAAGRRRRCVAVL